MVASVLILSLTAFPRERAAIAMLPVHHWPPSRLKSCCMPHRGVSFFNSLRSFTKHKHLAYGAPNLEAAPLNVLVVSGVVLLFLLFTVFLMFEQDKA